MANYLLAFHGGGMPETDAARAEAMAAWDHWYETLGDAIVDQGEAVAFARTVDTDGTVSDGGGEDPVSGYSILTADDIEAAIGMAQGCPILDAGGRVEVCETMTM
jgi:hypothetical protein